jgi:glutathione S-transferase
MLKLYTHPFSIVPWRVRIALHEKGLDYQSVKTDLYTKEPEQSFLRLNPFAQIPVLDDDGFVLAESLAIVEYLEEKYPEPRLMPLGLQLRATARKLMCWGTDYWPGAWKKWMAPRFPEAIRESWSEASVAQGREEIAHHLDVLDAQLMGGQRTHGDWLVGEYSLADVCYAPFVLVLDRVELGEEIVSRSRVAEWVEHLRARPAVVDTMMPQSP